MDSNVTPLPLARPLDPEQAAHVRGRLYRMACTMCGSPQLAEDLVQETYLKVLSQPRMLRNDSEFFYLTGALRNTVSNHFRVEGRRAQLGPEVDDHELADPSADADPESAVIAGELYAAIGALADGKRAVVAAVDVAGMSYSEAARALELPIGTIMSRLHRGRADLAQTLAAA